MRKRRPRLGVAIDMTPMVDVAFLLLIFFMTTTTFKPPEEVLIDLPKSHAEYKVPESDVLILTLTKDSAIYSQLGTHDPMSQVAPADVMRHVSDERAKNLRLRVIVRADRDCDYGAMEDLMAALQEARATRFVLMTEGEGPGGGQDLPAGDDEQGAGDLGSLHDAPGASVVRVASNELRRASGGSASWAQ